MKAMILAAGLGTRLRPLTDKIPKPLLPINGHPLIHYTLALLKRHGITDVVINLHYLGDQIRQALGNGKKLGFTIEYSDEPEILGTGGGILKAKSFFEDESDFLVINADIITDLDLTNLIREHRHAKALATLALKESPLSDDFGNLYADSKTHQIVAMLKDPPAEMVTQKGFFMGAHVISRELLDWTYPKPKACIVRDAYIPLLNQGKKFQAFFSDAYWNDLGTPQRLEQTQLELINQTNLLSYQSDLSTF